jgi:DNA polymerase III gamma/tau subunit
VNGDAEFGLSFRDYSFVPIEHFNDRHPSAHIVPPSHAGDIYQRTVFERNGYSFVNNHLVNEGVPVSAVEKGTRTHITPFVLTEEHLRPGEPIHNSTYSENKLTMYKPSIATAAPLSPPAVRERFTGNRSGFGQIITPQTNPQSWQTLQNSRQNASERAAKNQRAIAQAAQTEKNRINQEVQKETNQSKQAALKGEEAVQAMKAQKAQQHVQRAQSWTPPKEIIVPKISQPSQQATPPAAPAHAENKPTVTRAPENRPAVIIPPPVNRPTEQFHAQVRELNTEARTEQQRKETIESTVRTQAQSQWTKQQQQAHQGAPLRKGMDSGR